MVDIKKWGNIISLTLTGAIVGTSIALPIYARTIERELKPLVGELQELREMRDKEREALVEIILSHNRLTDFQFFL